MRKHFILGFCILSASIVYAQPLQDGEYFIKINATGKYLAIEGISQKNGAKLVQWDFVNQANHKFILKHQGNSAYTLQAVHSQKYVSSDGANPKVGAHIIQWDWVNQDNQRWLITPAPSGKGFVMRCLKNYLKVVVENYNAATSTSQNGSALKLISNEDIPPMILDFKKNETTVPTIEIKIPKPDSKKLPGDVKYPQVKLLADVPDGIYKIKINESGKYLAIAGQLDHSNGMRLIQWDMLPRNNHLFKVTRLDNGNYSIAPVHSEKVLDVVDMKTADGTPVQQWDNLNGSNQQWKFFRVGKETELSIISVSTGKRLQLAGAQNATDNGHQLVIKQNTGQTFHLIPARPHKFVEYITLRDVFFTVPKLGKDQEMCGEIKVHVINKFGQSKGSYYVTPNNILFDRRERNTYDMSKTGILKIPGEYKFKITSEELVGSKIVITYGINENDASVFTTFGSENNGIHGDNTWVPDMTPEVFGGADDFYLLKNSFNDCLKSKLEPGRFSNNQSFFITNIPPFCKVHVNMQDEDGSDNWFDVHFTLTKESR